MPRRTVVDPEAEIIGKRIRALREEHGLGLEELAHAADFSKGHLSNLERGLVMPTVATLKVLPDHLGVLVGDLVTFPEDGPRQALIELTRTMTTGTIRKLLKELGAKKKSPRATSARLTLARPSGGRVCVHHHAGGC